MGRVLEDGVGGDGLAAVVVEGFARVGVDVEAGKVAAGDVDTVDIDDSLVYNLIRSGVW